MNSAKSPNPLHLIITGLLLGIIFFFITSDFNRDQERNRQNSELTIQNDSIIKQLHKTSKERDSLFLRITELNRIDSVLTRDLAKTRRELSSIRGRYNQWSNDSLAKEMNRRAGAN